MSMTEDEELRESVELGPTGTVSGVAAVYNRYRYADEMAGAVAKWEDHLRSLTRSV